MLEHLSAVGFAQSPRVVGTDGDSDLLGYIPGASGADGWAPAVTEQGLAAAARLLRGYTTPYETGSRRPTRHGSTARSARAVRAR